MVKALSDPNLGTDARGVAGSVTPQSRTRVYGLSCRVSLTGVPLAMSKLEPIVFVQLPAIRQIVIDETWLEAERRGCWVNADDCVVRENVCLVVLRIGAELRESAERALATAPRLIPFV